MKKYRDSDEAQTLKNLTNVVTTNDLRFYPYELEDNTTAYLPSVTTILDKAAPKNEMLIKWFKDMPSAEQAIHVQKAAEEGSNVHNALEQYVLGHDVNLFCTNEYTGESYQCYSMKEWEMVGRGVEALNMLKKLYPRMKIHLVEQKLASAQLGYAGTCDLVVKVGREHWLIDYKTSNSLSDTMCQQTIAYTDLLKDILNINIKRRFILWLKANTRKYNEKNMSGKGWSLVEHTDDELDRELWSTYLKIFNHKFLTSTKPNIKTFPSTFSHETPYFQEDYSNLL